MRFPRARSTAKNRGQGMWFAPREPGSGDAQERQPAAEEHGLAAVAREERLAALEERLAPASNRPGRVSRRRAPWRPSS